MPHYLYIFLVGMTLAGAWAIGPFSLLFSLSIGLNVKDIGEISGVACIVAGCMIMLSGWLADRYHPVRIVLLGVILQVLLAIPAGMTWLFFQPSPQTSYWLCMVYAVAINAPVGALMGVFDPPMLMRLFPHSHYGQFCSANAMWRSVSLIINGTLVGVFFDLLGGWVGKERAYAFIPVWQLFYFLLMLFFMYKVYYHWKKLGGDNHYVAIIPEFPATQNKEEYGDPSNVAVLEAVPEVVADRNGCDIIELFSSQSPDCPAAKKTISR